MGKNFKTVWLLAAISAMGMSSVPMMMLIGSIIGAQLAPAEQWATLPIAMMVIGTACGVVPAARCMQHIGRRKTLGLFLLLGIFACILIGQALAENSFVLFCLGASMLGATAAAIQQIRYAAMECVPLSEGPTAASIIMCAGIIAAIIGPELALAGKNLLSVDYQGSFWLGAGCMLLRHNCDRAGRYVSDGILVAIGDVGYRLEFPVRVWYGFTALDLPGGRTIQGPGIE